MVAMPMGGAMMRRQPGPVPFAAIDRYARRYGYEGAAFDELLVLVTAMDEEYLAVAAEQARE